MQTISRQTVQFIPANLHITQRPRHAQFADDGVEDITQISSLYIDIVGLEDFEHVGIVDQEFSYACLPFSVCVVRCVEFAHGWEEDAACFAVADAEWTELESH